MKIQNDTMLVESFQNLGSQLKRHKLLTFIIMVITYGITVTMLVRATRSYEVSTSLLPPLRSREEVSVGVETLAKNFGLGMGMKTQDNSLLYENILKSRLLLGKMIEQRFTFQGINDQSLYQIYSLDTSQDSVKIFAKLLTKIRNKINVERDGSTGFVTINFSTGDAHFGAIFLNKLVEEMAQYFRSAYAEINQEKYEYLKRGLDSAITSLAKSSSNLTSFRERNRNILPSESPQIAYQMMELEREVRIDEERFLLFKKETELIKLQMKEEQFNIKVLDVATPAVIGETGRLKIALVGLFLGPFFALLAVQISEWLVLIINWRRPAKR